MKLDYIRDLGADLIWLSPVYASPDHDYGYDISDYTSIHPDFGTMDDFNLLISEAAKRGLGIIMDLVPNHTSDMHPWFRNAISEKNSKYRSYYIFREGKNGKEPNNWLSFFGGSAWTKDERSGEYYLTSFTPHQCDLNWENPEVRKEIYGVMRFWLEKGVAGFRMDVINAISKAPGLPDKDPHKKGYQFPFELALNREPSHEYLREMNREVLSKYDCFSVGEGTLSGMEDVIKYTNPDRQELMMMFQFDLHGIGCGPLGKFDFRKLYLWSIPEFKNIVDRWQLRMQEGGGWLGNFLSNHDQPRHVSRFGNGTKYRTECAKAFCLLNLTLRGTPFIYQGEECGMTNSVFERKDWRDYEAINDFKALQTMMHLPSAIAERVINRMTRDHARTPVQWNSGENAGFTEGEPWIKLNPNYPGINIEDDLKRNDSIGRFYREVIALRKRNKVLTYGKYFPVDRANRRAISYIRDDGKKRMLIVINLTGKKSKADFSGIKANKSKILIGTHGKRPFFEKMELQPYEGRVYLLSPERNADE
jgi:oligo-1,6-glucosidase